MKLEGRMSVLAVSILACAGSTGLAAQGKPVVSQGQSTGGQITSADSDATDRASVSDTDDDALDSEAGTGGQFTSAPEAAANLPESPDAGYFGAYAFKSSTGNWGAAWNWPTQKSASRSAKSGCGGGRQCRIVLKFSRGYCGAFAAGNSGWGTGRAPTLSGAQNTALFYCNQFTTGCSIVHSVCNNP